MAFSENIGTRPPRTSFAELPELPEDFSGSEGTYAGLPTSLTASKSAKKIEQISNATFAEFLKTRADPKNGFSTKDHLKYRYVEFVNAQGLGNKIKAFLNLGGLGYFFAGKVDESNRKALAKESNFYHQCCKVQEFYQKFNKKPDSANFKALKEAYEAVLALAENKDPIQHDQINNILNNRFAKGESVGAAILEHIATSKFIPQDGFTEKSIIDTISGPQFFADIHAKHAQGYRGETIDENKRLVINAYNTERKSEEFQWPEIQRVLNEEAIEKGVASIFMSYARVYTAQVQENDGAGVSLKLGFSLRRGEVSEEQINRQINRDNKRILELIQSPSPIYRKDLPFGFQTDEIVIELDRAAAAYSNYDAGVDDLPRLNSELANAVTAKKKANDEYTAELGKVGKYSLEELEKVFGKVEELEKVFGAVPTLPGVAAYKDYMQKKSDLEAALTQNNQAIQDKIKELQKFVSDTETEEKRLAETVQTQYGRLEYAAQMLNKALKEVNGQTGNIVEETAKLKGKKSVPAANEIQDVEETDTDKAFSEASKIYREAKKTYILVKQNHENMVQQNAQELARAKADLKLLEQPTTENKHALIASRDDTLKELHQTATVSLMLTYADIAKICEDEKAGSLPAFEKIHEQIDGLKAKLEEASTAQTNIENDIEETKKEIKDSLVVLGQSGFVVDEEKQQLGELEKFNFVNFDKDYRETLGETLKRQAPLNADIIKVLQKVTYSTCEVNKEVVQEQKFTLPPLRQERPYSTLEDWENATNVRVRKPKSDPKVI